MRNNFKVKCVTRATQQCVGMPFHIQGYPSYLGMHPHILGIILIEICIRHRLPGTSASDPQWRAANSQHFFFPQASERRSERAPRSARPGNRMPIHTQTAPKGYAAQHHPTPTQTPPNPTRHTSATQRGTATLTREDQRRGTPVDLKRKAAAEKG